MFVCDLRAGGRPMCVRHWREWRLEPPPGQGAVVGLGGGFVEGWRYVTEDGRQTRQPGCEVSGCRLQACMKRKGRFICAAHRLMLVSHQYKQ